MLDLLLFALLGVAAGIVTGVTPGLHVNAVSLLLLALPLAPLAAAVLIIAIAITHTFWDFVPSILLGAPSEDTALGVLPGHRLLLEGRGAEAITLTIAGGIAAALLSAAALPALLLGLPVLYAALRPFIGFILLAIAGFMVAIEPTWRRRLAGLAVLGLSGLLGLVTLDSALLAGDAVLFPLFTGLFGASTLLLSLREQSRIPAQRSGTAQLERGLVLRGSVKGLLSGCLMGTLPALGASQAAVLTQHLSRKGFRRRSQPPSDGTGRGSGSREQPPEEFLVSIGAINTVVSLFSLIALYTIAKPRSGAAVAVGQVLGPVGFPELVLLVAVSLFAAGLSALALLAALPRLIAGFQAVPYAALTKGILVLLVFLVIALTGPLGLAVLATAVAIGVLAPLWKVKRSLLMGVLMVPLILFYSSL
ncbi:MAG TPA: tripartite tricarboxylate transporter permease [archaeon]|nr:tripartite tricarboxylate transporter permease [archaeon]